MIKIHKLLLFTSLMILLIPLTTPYSTIIEVDGENLQTLNNPLIGTPIQFETASASTTLEYGDFLYMITSDNFGNSSYINWDYIADSTGAWAYVYLMDFENFDAWYAGGSAQGYELDWGTGGSGITIPGYDATWVFLIYHGDTSFEQYPIDASVTLDANIAVPEFTSFNHTTSDVNDDGYNDQVMTTFDVNMPYEDNSGNVTVNLFLRDTQNTTVSMINQTYYITGLEFQPFELSLGDVPKSGDYYIYAEVKPTGYVNTSSYTTLSFELFVTDFDTAFFNSFSWETSDTDQDGYNDQVILNFDPNFENTTNSGEIDVQIIIRDNSNNIVYDQTIQYSIIGSEIDDFEVRWNDISQVDYYNISANVAPSGKSITDIYHVSELVGLTPVGYGFSELIILSHELFDRDNDGYTDSLKITYDVNFNKSINDIVEIVFETYEEDILVETHAKTLSISGNQIDEFTYIVNGTDQLVIIDRLKLKVKTLGDTTYSDSTEITDIVVYSTGVTIPTLSDVGVLLSSSYGGDNDTATVEVDIDVVTQQYIYVIGELFDSSNNLVFSIQGEVVLVAGDQNDKYVIQFENINKTENYYIVLKLYIDGIIEPVETYQSEQFELKIKSSSSTEETTSSENNLVSSSTDKSYFVQVFLAISAVFLIALMRQKKIIM